MEDIGHEDDSYEFPVTSNSLRDISECSDDINTACEGMYVQDIYHDTSELYLASSVEIIYKSREERSIDCLGLFVLFLFYTISISL